MIHVTIIAVGKLKKKYLRDGCAEYIKRLSAFAKVEVLEVQEERCGNHPSEAEKRRVMEKEGRRILAKLPKGAYVIPLCIEGQAYASEEFARCLSDVAMRHASIVFVVGGSFGLSPEVKAQGRQMLSFGKMTLPHQLARLVLLEQVYRAFSIQANTQYHK